MMPTSSKRTIDKNIRLEMTHGPRKFSLDWPTGSEPRTSFSPDGGQTCNPNDASSVCVDIIARAIVGPLPPGGTRRGYWLLWLKDQPTPRFTWLDPEVGEGGDPALLKQLKELFNQPTAS